jgi:DMSO reductase family type II enzyme chaperone
MNPLERAEMYDLLAKLFYQPTADGLAPVDTAAAVRRLDEAARANGLPGIAPRHLELGSAELREEFTRVFTHSISKECPPYETEYGESHVFMQTADLGDIQGFYRAFGVSPHALAHERPDQLGFELEFMAFLAAKEEVVGGEGAEICREASTKFLRDHVGRWTPAFCARLAKRAEGGLYADLARILKAWMDAEIKFHDINPDDVKSLDMKPPAYDPDSSDCSTCGMGDIPDTFFNLGAKP